MHCAKASVALEMVQFLASNSASAGEFECGKIGNAARWDVFEVQSM